MYPVLFIIYRIIAGNGKCAVRKYQARRWALWTGIGFILWVMLFLTAGEGKKSDVKQIGQVKVEETKVGTISTTLEGVYDGTWIGRESGDLGGSVITITKTKSGYSAEWAEFEGPEQPTNTLENLTVTVSGNTVSFFVGGTAWRGALNSTGLIATDGTVYTRKEKEQDNRRTEEAGWECLKWGMSKTEVETLLKANGFMDKSSSLDSHAAHEIDLTYEANPDGLVKRVGKKMELSIFSSEKTNVEINELTGYKIQRPTKRDVIDTFVFYQGCLVGVVTKHDGPQAFDDSSSFSSALKEKYGGETVEAGISPLRFRYASDSLNIAMYTFYRSPFTGVEINYSDPKRIKSAVNKEMVRREEARKEKVKKAKDIL